MTGKLSPRTFRRRGRRGLRRMTELQRAIFCAVRFDDATYAEMAQRHGLSLDEVVGVMAGALRILSSAVREPEPWWRRLWPW